MLKFIMFVNLQEKRKKKKRKKPQNNNWRSIKILIFCTLNKIFFFVCVSLCVSPVLLLFFFFTGSSLGQIKFIYVQ